MADSEGETTDRHGWILPDHPDALVFLGQVIDDLPHALFVKDREFRYVLVNREILRVSGIARESIVGKTDYDFLPRPTADLYRTKDLEVLSLASVVTIAEEEMIDRAGRRRVFSTRKVPMRNAAGEITHIVGVLSDITRLKGVEEDLRLSSVELERRVIERTHALALAQDDLVRKERLAVLGRLAGGVAHQIRNPLGAIKNAAYVLQRRMREAKETPFTDPVAQDEVTHSIEIIHDEVQRANQIITDLLDYARVRVPVRRPTAIGSVIEQALDAIIIPENVKVVRRLPALPSIAVDADQLQGALYNVLRNAVEAMALGGTLTLEAEVRAGQVIVRIEDTGEGIPKDILDRLFEPLITSKPLGLGLGLVTARTLIEGQGGTIRHVGGPRASGACFEVALPSPDEALQVPA